MLDILFGPNRSSDRAEPSGSRAVYQTVDGRLCARVGGVDEKAARETADELEWLRHSVGILRDAILAHKKEKEAQYDPLPALMHEDVTLWSHVME